MLQSFKKLPSSREKLTKFGVLWLCFYLRNAYFTGTDSPFLGSPRIRGAGIVFGIPGVDDKGIVLAGDTSIATHHFASSVLCQDQWQ